MPLGVDAGCKEPFVAPCCFRHTYSDARSSWRGAVLYRLNTLEGNSILTHGAAKSSSPCGSQRRSKPDRRASVSTLSGRRNSNLRGRILSYGGIEITFPLIAQGQPLARQRHPSSQ